MTIHDHPRSWRGRQARRQRLLDELARLAETGEPLPRGWDLAAVTGFSDADAVRAAVRRLLPAGACRLGVRAGRQDPPLHPPLCALGRRLRREEGGVSRSSSITVRLTEEQRTRLDEARGALPYRLSVTEIITRGIELAARELEEMERASRGQQR